LPRLWSLNVSANERQEKEHHCDICREIAEGCEKERLAGGVPNCDVCGRKGFIDRGDGTGIACNACARGFRMKLWLRHQAGKSGDVALISVA
jgi:hypothetical protein